MGGAPAPAPMGGASDVPPMGDMGPTGPEGDPAGAPDAGMDGMNDGNGQLDPNMGPMGGEPPMDGDPMAGGEEGSDDSTISIINQLNDKDKETVRAYAESLLSTEEENDGQDEPMDGEDMGGQDPNAAPMMESFIFTKKQLKKLNENFNDKDREEKNKGNNKARGKNTAKDSPFKSPRFE